MRVRVPPLVHAYMHYAHLINPYTVLKKVGTVADQLQLATYVVGGFVRDLLLKRPSQDIDIVCLGNGIGLAEAVAEHLEDCSPVTVFKNFGTAMLHWQGWKLEFVGARKESYRRNSRKPRVEEGTLTEDQYRRDFTINAIAIGLHRPQWGELVDVLGSLQDLQQQVLRTPLDPEVTFSDDPLRMMRAIRFATQLQFTIQDDALRAIRKNADRIQIVSQERITDEIHKIMRSPSPGLGWQLLQETALLPRILPELAALQGKETIRGHSHKDNFYHTLQVVDNVAQVTDNLWLRWAALLHDIAKPLTKRFDPITGFSFHGHEELGGRMVPAIFRRMKLPMKKHMPYVQKLVRLHLRPIVIAQDIVTDAAVRRLIAEAGDALPDLMILCRADITSSNPVRVRQYLQNFDKVESKVQALRSKDYIRNFQPVISGEVIMQAFHLQPGKVVGEIKADIKEAMLAGHIDNEYEEAYAYMLTLGKAKGL